MRMTRTVELEGRSVHLRELTVAEVRQWLLDLKARQPAETIDEVHALLFEDIDLADLVRMSDITLEQLDELPPSAIDKLIAAAKTVNSHFFGLRKRLFDIGKKMMAKNLSADSNFPVVASSGRDTAASGPIPGGSI